MTFTKTLLMGATVLSLAACQTTSAISSPNDILLSGIDKSAVSPVGLPSGSATLLSATHPTCAQFYENVGTFVTAPVPKASGPSFGGQLMRTVVLASLAGVAGGSVSALGIKSSFTETALAATATQVTYNTGGDVYDKVVGADKKTPQVPAAPNLSPLQSIEKVAASIGCPAPDAAAIAALQP